MKHSWATLFLCSSISLLALAQGPSTHAPWLDNPTTIQEPIPVAPQTQGALRDFTFSTDSTKNAPAPWIKDIASNYSRQASPVGEAAANAIDFDLQVFISSGMPDGVLRSLFKQALDEGATRVRFVVRGFEPQKLGELMKKLRMLLPDPYKDDILVEIDPNAFRAYNVQQVPVYLVKNQDKWYSLKGAISLDGAREQVRKGGAYSSGELYAIAEPDVLSIVEDRAQKYDWESAFTRARERAGANLKPHFDLPTVIADAIDYYVPTFTVPEDVTGPGPDGKGTVLLGKAGQEIRLLDYTKLQVPMIALDATDARQVKMVQGWLTRPEYKNADVFIVGSEMPSPGATVPMEILSKQLNRPVFPLFKRLGERMGVQAVPAIIEQEGDRLRIRYFNPQPRS